MPVQKNSDGSSTATGEACHRCGIRAGRKNDDVSLYCHQCGSDTAIDLSHWQERFRGWNRHRWYATAAAVIVFFASIELLNAVGIDLPLLLFGPIILGGTVWYGYWALWHKVFRNWAWDTTYNEQAQLYLAAYPYETLRRIMQDGTYPKMRKLPNGWQRVRLPSERHSLFIKKSPSGELQTLSYWCAKSVYTWREEYGETLKLAFTYPSTSEFEAKYEEDIALLRRVYRAVTPLLDAMQRKNIPPTRENIIRFLDDLPAALPPNPELA